MRKLFFAICFNLLFFSLSSARVTPVSGYDGILRPQDNTVQEEVEVREVEIEDFKHFLQERFANSPKADSSSINKNIGYLPSLTRQQMEAEKNKSIFQKMYEGAINRISQTPSPLRDDVATTEDQVPDISLQETNWSDTEVPLITAYLPPNNTAVSIPALEHIPYLMNSIEVLPSGLVKFEETIVVVANGNKLRKGLTKILPQYIYNSKGQSHHLDYSIIGVRVNDMPIDYHLTSNGRNVLLVPQEDYRLDPGIYTYKFEYVVDNLLWNYGDFYQLYWDVGGNGWNLVVDRLGASLSLPSENGLIAQEVLLGSIHSLNSNAVSIFPNGNFATAFVAKRPLFIGEGMHIVANISAQTLISPTIWQRIIRLFYDYGDIFLAFIGFVVISLSLAVSWRYIYQNKVHLKIPLPKTAMIMRYILMNRFDLKSVCGFLLELYKKNIIDIQQSGETILLIKRTDNLKGLPLFEVKALNYIFPAHETVFNVTAKNLLPLKRFALSLEQGVRKQMLKFRLKLNLGYLLFSMAMLIATEAFIASFKINSLYSFTVMFCASIACLIAISLWQFGKHRWLKLLVRLMVLDIILVSFVIFSAVISPLAGLLIILAIVIIVISLGVYSKRLGLIKHYIQDIAKFKEYIQNHHDSIILGRDFLNYQAAIWIFDIEEEFKLSNDKEYNKLPIMTNILNLWK